MTKSEQNKIGRWGATSYFIGSVVGSGIFITPTTILNRTGSVGLSLLIWLLSAAATTLGAFCYIELGTSIRRSGGDFAYLSYVKWRPLAFMFMVTGCVLTYPLFAAIQAVTFAEYTVQGLGLDALIDADQHPTAALALRKLIAFSSVWLMIFLNFFSLRAVVAPFQLVTAVAKFLSALLIVGIGIYWFTFKGYTENLHQPFANSSMDVGNLTNAFFAGLFNYDGWDVLNYGIEEVSNPARTMPFAIFTGMTCSTLIYATINFAFFAVLSVSDIQKSTAVAMTFAEQTMGGFSRLMPFIISLVLLNALNASIFTGSRYLYAVARERQIPSFIACINRTHDSPRAALIVYAIFTFIGLFLGNIDELVGYLGFAIWLQRGCAMCCLLYIRFKHLPVHPEAIRVPIVFPFLFLAICFSLSMVTIIKDFSTAYIGLTIMAIALTVYAIFIWEKTLNRISFYRQISSYLNEFSVRIVQILTDGLTEIVPEKMDYAD
uniref:Amino acid transporter n=1 Tax=Globodera rostochiensis TaxID=31243 RepID=A0A914I2T4_GLORO